MNPFKYMAGVVLAAMAISSCDEDTLTIGNSLTDQGDQLDVAATTFNVSTQTIVADSVLSLSSDCYFGKVKDPETGAYVTSEFTTQFHLLEFTYMSPEDSLVTHQEDGRAVADSCDIVLYLSSPFKSDDSLTAMKMRISELEYPTEEGVKYYSNFDPMAQGMVRVGGLQKNKMFSYANLAESDSLRSSSSYQQNIRISLNEPYTDKQGNTYNNYGTYLMRNYYDHPEFYRNSYVFIHELCPGFFFQITDGLGFHSKVTNIGLHIYYSVNRGDTATVAAALTLAGTKEVLQTTKVTNDQEAIEHLAAETTHTYLKSPAGLYTEVTLPVEDIKAEHVNDSLIAAKIAFQRLNNNSTDSRMLGIPQTILMLPKDSLITYFENNYVPDNKLSFYTTYSSDYNTYTFTNISNLITNLWNMKVEGEKTNANWAAAHSNWNKVVLVPITYTTSSSSTTPTLVEHDMSLTSTRLVGGADSPDAPIQISVVYAKFKDK